VTIAWRPIQPVDKMIDSGPCAAKFQLCILLDIWIVKYPISYWPHNIFVVTTHAKCLMQHVITLWNVAEITDRGMKVFSVLKLSLPLQEAFFSNALYIMQKSMAL
jgi:hypothetical protein